MRLKSKAGDDLKVKDTNLHMVFLGNPGTGKTTVARMVAGILYNLGYIEQNKLIEVSAKDLIGQYVGQTAPKTMGVIEKALGGVLFIDEAYSLASKPGTSGSQFNEECIATLIQAMENYRDNLVVIFAGYTKEMDAFLKSNSGIVSRIGYTMDFKDYTVDELIEIFKSMFKKSGFTVEKSAIEKAKEVIEEYRHTEGFGNARFVRNLYEKAIIKHATNTQNATSKKVLRTITAKDITSENILKM
jgi:AAA+ superfamily predicted ATPase